MNWSEYPRQPRWRPNIWWINDVRRFRSHSSGVAFHLGSGHTRLRRWVVASNQSGQAKLQRATTACSARDLLPAASCSTIRRTSSLLIGSPICSYWHGRMGHHDGRTVCPYDRKTAKFPCGGWFGMFRWPRNARHTKFVLQHGLSTKAAEMWGILIGAVTMTLTSYSATGSSPIGRIEPTTDEHRLADSPLVRGQGRPDGYPPDVPRPAPRA